MKLIPTLILASFASAASAQQNALSITPPLACQGFEPDWTLYVEGATAQFEFQRQSDLTVMLDTPAQGDADVRALTLIGRGDSVILIVEPARCETGDTTGPMSARILTQRGETPLLLTGCCMYLQG